MVRQVLNTSDQLSCSGVRIFKNQSGSFNGIFIPMILVSNKFLLNRYIKQDTRILNDVSELFVFACSKTYNKVLSMNLELALSKSA